MLVLAIDTSTKLASVALYDDKIGVVGETTLYVKTNHSNIIMSLIDNLLKMTGITLKDIDKIAVSIGPGSFTGIRIGVAIAKGLTYGTDKKIVGVNELDAIAHNVEKRDGIIVPLIDARKERVYYSMYKYENSELVRICEYKDGELKDLLKNMREHKYTFVGDGAIVYSERIKENMKDRANIFSKSLSIPRGSVIGQIAIDKIEDNLYTLEPFYVNKSQAEREKEKKEKEIK